MSVSGDRVPPGLGIDPGDSGGKTSSIEHCSFTTAIVNVIETIKEYIRYPHQHRVKERDQGPEEVHARSCGEGGRRPSGYCGDKGQGGEGNVSRCHQGSGPADGRGYHRRVAAHTCLATSVSARSFRDSHHHPFLLWHTEVAEECSPPNRHADEARHHHVVQVRGAELSRDPETLQGVCLFPRHHLCSQQGQTSVWQQIAHRVR
jgi:hypothetical protein